MKLAAKKEKTRHFDQTKIGKQKTKKFKMNL